MLHISGFFDRYLKKQKEKENQQQFIISEIGKILHRDTSLMQYTVKGDTLYCTGSLHEKQQIFIQKAAIIEILQTHPETAHIHNIQ